MSAESGAYPAKSGDPCPLECPGVVWADHAFLTCNNCLWTSEDLRCSDEPSCDPSEGDHVIVGRWDRCKCGVLRVQTCPDGCGCRVGTDDADGSDCACGGPCQMGWDDDTVPPAATSPSGDEGTS